MFELLILITDALIAFGLPVLTDGHGILIGFADTATSTSLNVGADLGLNG